MDWIHDESILDQVLLIFNTNLNIKQSDIGSCYRLGKPNARKSRPLLVNFFN